MERTLGQLPLKRSAVIVRISDTEMSAKFFEFGLLPGAVVLVLTRAPLNGPLCILLGEVRMMMRKKEAELIFVE